jgi:hypothetical protein
LNLETKRHKQQLQRRWRIDRRFDAHPCKKYLRVHLQETRPKHKLLQSDFVQALDAARR